MPRVAPRPAAAACGLRAAACGLRPRTKAEAEALAAPLPGGRTDLENLLALCVAVRAEVGRAEAGEVGGHLIDAVGDLGF